jgi:hypothetical protein
MRFVFTHLVALLMGAALVGSVAVASQRNPPQPSNAALLAKLNVIESLQLRAISDHSTSVRLLFAIENKIGVGLPGESVFDDLSKLDSICLSLRASC